MMAATETAPLPPHDSEKMAWGGQWAGGGAPLLSAEAAQRTRVVRLPGLLSIAEVDSVHELAAACFATAGRDLGKYDGSWETTYLHTAGLFRQRAPALLEKLVDAAWAADLDMAAGGACQLAGRARDSVGLRVIEYHDVTAGGGLPDPQHRDLGSLLTLDVMLSQPGVDFEGGSFCTLEPGGVLSHEPSWLQQRGDAVLFVSHKLQAVRGLGMLSDALSSGDGGMVSVALAGLSLIDPLLSARIDDVRAEANLLREARKTQQERQLHLARPPPLQRSSSRGGRIDSLSQQTAMT